MKYIVILIVIVFFWFFLGLSLTYISNDETLTSYAALNSNFSIVNGTTYFNSSGNPDSYSGGSATGFLEMSVRMFLFAIPENVVPSGINAVITFLNWFLLLILIATIYRIANPLGGG